MSDQFKMSISDIRIYIEPDENPVSAVYKGLELLLIQGTPSEQNCVVLARPYRTDDDDNGGWNFSEEYIGKDLHYSCKAWWNHYRGSFGLQEFLDGLG